MSVRAYRAGMIAGAASAILLFLGFSCLVAATPDTSNKTADEVSAKWLDFVNDSGHRWDVAIGSFLLVLAAIALIWFASTLRNRLDRNGPMMGFAMLAAVGVALGGVGPLALIGGNFFADDPLPGTSDGGVVWFVYSLVFPAVFVVFGVAMAAFLASVAVAGRGVLPTWLVWFAWLAALGALAAVEFFPLILVPLWLLVAGIVGALKPAAADAAA